MRILSHIEGDSTWTMLESNLAIAIAELSESADNEPHTIHQLLLTKK